MVTKDAVLLNVSSRPFTCILDSTAQHSTAQHSTAQHSTAQHSTAQHSTAQHSTAQHSTAQHSTAPHRTAPTSFTSEDLSFSKACRVRTHSLSLAVAFFLGAPLACNIAVNTCLSMQWNQKVFCFVILI